jgi:hypothetical protein
MAQALGLHSDADRWAESAEKIRQLILAQLYVPEDAAFYDLDAQGQFVRVRSDVLSRVCGEHVVDKKAFEILWERQLHNPGAFWAPYPLPSIALDDPKFTRPIPSNSWGGPSQALTALRAPRWFDFYGKPAELSHLMNQWCEAIQRDMTFRQQIDPITGDFAPEDMPDYSPSALVMMDFTWRLIGVRQQQDLLEWNVRPHHPASQSARLQRRFDGSHTVAMSYEKSGAALHLNGRQFCQIDSGVARLTTDKQGHPKFLTGISETTETISLRVNSQPAKTFTIYPNQQLKLD